MEEFKWTENILSILFLVDKKFNILYANQTALKEFNWNTFTNKSVLSLMNKDVQQMHKNLNMEKQQTNRMNTKITLPTSSGNKEYNITVSPCQNDVWLCLLQNNKLEIYYDLGKESQEWLKGYTLLEKINKGSIGEIYKCQNQNGEIFAMKIMMKNRLIYDKRLLIQARNEINILQKLNHPNIIKYVDGWETIEKIIIIQELGCNDLFEKITKNDNGFLLENNAKIVFRQIVSALAYIHSNFIIHRDIKPENIICIDGIPKIIDFGLAKILPPKLLKTNTQCGTIDYIAPEVVNKSKLYDFEADIWSVGTLLYTMLCGRFPFEGDTINEISTNIQCGKYNIDFHPWNNISDNAKDLIKKMFVINPNNRIKAKEILEHPWLMDELVKPNVLDKSDKILPSKPKKIGLQIPHSNNYPNVPPTPRHKRDNLWNVKERLYKLPDIKKNY